jgi:pimeloyl-ACP methyl ester carboxylesterase
MLENVGDFMSLYYSETGPESAETILFLYGGGAAAWVWQPQVDALKYDYHCLVPDLPEHGRSAEVKPFTIQGAASMAADLIREKAHRGRAHIIGISQGAQIALSLLALASDLADHAMISSAIVRPLPGGMDKISPKMAEAMYRWSVEPFKWSRWWAKVNMKYSAGIPDAYFPQFFETYQNMNAGLFTRILVENQRFRLPAGLERVTAPVLVVAGRNEYKAMMQSVGDIVAALPNARGCLVQHSRRMSLAQEHNWSITTPELFTRTVRTWIEGQPLPEELKPLSTYG